FAKLRGYQGSDLAARSNTIRTVTCPFAGEELAAVAAINPDVRIIHAQRADTAGNVRVWGIFGVQKEAVHAAKRALVTVEEVVDELEPVPGGIVLPNWVVSAVAPVPGGAHPSYAAGYTDRDNSFYTEWDGIARDRDTFADWMAAHVLEQTGANR